MNRLKLPALIFCLFLLPLLSQGHMKDTALSRILRMPLDTNRVMALVDLGWKGLSNNFKASKRFADIAYTDSRALKWSKGIVRAYLLKARILDYLGDYREALQINFEALKISNKNSFELESARSLRQIGGMYEAMGDYKKAITYLNASLNKAKKINYLKGIASSMSDLGIVYYLQSDFTQASELFNKSLQIKLKIGDLRNIAVSYNYLGDIYENMGYYNKSIDYAFRGFSINQKINNKSGIATSLSKIGELYLKMNQYKKSIGYLNKSTILKQSLGEKHGIANNLVSFGLLYSKLGNIEKALAYLKKGLEIQKFLGDIKGQSLTLTTIGNLYVDIKNYDDAIKTFNECLLLDKYLQSSFNILEDYLNISKVFFKKDNISTSELYLKKASTVLKSNPNLFFEQEIYEMQSLLFEKKHQYKASLKAYKQYIVLRDSVLSLNNKTALALKEAKFEFDTKAYADSLKNVEIQKAKDLQLKLQHSELQKQKLKQTAMLSGIAVLMLLGWLLFSRYKAVNLQRISERKLLLLEKDQALVDERNRIADEMHDDVGADLSNLLLKIRMKERKQSALNTEDLGALKNSANTIIYKIDEIIWSLNAQRDTLNELLNFIQKYFDTLLKDNQLKGEFVCNNQIPNYPLSAQLRRNIFLTVKEILNNALKHSEASEVNMQVEFCNNKLKIQIADNGNGFEPTKTHKGNGMASMKKRIQESNGTLDIKSKNGTGTYTTLEIELG